MQVFLFQVSYIEDVVEKTNYHLEDDSPYTVRYDTLVEVREHIYFFMTESSLKNIFF